MDLFMGPHHCIQAHVFGSQVDLNGNDLRQILTSTVSSLWYEKTIAHDEPTNHFPLDFQYRAAELR
jgi:hypothetical protein